MTGRIPACEDAATISARLRELEAERMAAIAGCICGTLGPSQRDVAGNLVHAPQCPLRTSPPPSQMELATEALWRARVRARLRTRCAAERYVEEIERAIAERAVRLWVLS